MKCKKCGAEIYSGQKFCASCGWKIDTQNITKAERATIYITEEEARTGCQKNLNLPGFPMPMRFSLKPGMADKKVLKVENARFADANGNVVIRPLEVTIRVTSKPHQSRAKTKKFTWKYFAIAVAVCLVIFAAYRGTQEHSDKGFYSESAGNNAVQFNFDSERIARATGYAQSLLRDYYPKNYIYNKLLDNYFTEEETQYVTDNLGADWNAVALARAQRISHSGSKQSTYESLVYDGFTEEEARYAVDNLSVDWKMNALSRAKSRNNEDPVLHLGDSRTIYEVLVDEQYTEEEIQYAMDNLN